MTRSLRRIVKFVSFVALVAGVLTGAARVGVNHYLSSTRGKALVSKQLGSAIGMPVEVSEINVNDGGSSFGFRVSEVQKEAGEELDFEDQTKTFDFGIAFGGGVSFDKLVIDARFTLGLTNIINETGKADLGPNADAKNRSFALTVGWRFR